MKTETKTLEESRQMTALLEEANQILKGATGLKNEEKEKLGNIFEQMMYWDDKENTEQEECYNQFSELLKSMLKLDFSKRLSFQTPKSLMHFLAVGFNTLNEELNRKAFSVKMFHTLLEGLELKKNTLLLITDAEGIITFLHTDIDKPHFQEEVLVGQSISVLFKEDFKTIDNLFKTQGTQKSIEVNMPYDKTGKVSLRLALPTMMNSFEGLAYAITILEKD